MADLIIFDYKGALEFTFRPKTRSEGVQNALALFELTEDTIHFMTDQLPFCEGKLVGVGEKVWSQVLENKAITKLFVIEKPSPVRPTAQTPLIPVSKLPPPKPSYPINRGPQTVPSKSTNALIPNVSLLAAPQIATTTNPQKLSASTQPHAKSSPKKRRETVDDDPTYGARSRKRKSLAKAQVSIQQAQVVQTQATQPRNISIENVDFKNYNLSSILKSSHLSRNLIENLLIAHIDKFLMDRGDGFNPVNVPVHPEGRAEAKSIVIDCVASLRTDARLKDVPRLLGSLRVNDDLLTFEAAIFVLLQRRKNSQRELARRKLLEPSTGPDESSEEEEQGGDLNDYCGGAEYPQQASRDIATSSHAVHAGCMSPDLGDIHPPNSDAVAFDLAIEQAERSQLSYSHA